MAFAIWSYPGETLFHAVENDPVTLNHLGDLRSPVFVIKPFLPSEPVTVIQAAKIIELESATDWLKLRLQFFQLTEANSLPDYESLVSKAVKEIKLQKAFEKVVLSRYEDIAVNQLSPHFLDELRQKYPNAFVCCFSSQEHGTWVLASPELFLSLKDNLLSSFSLAGTQITNQQDLGTKEKTEQEIVTNFIATVFKTEGLNPTIKKRSTTTSGDLKHLLSQVQGITNKDFNINNLIQALHPTPAVGGQKKSIALNFIQTEEGYDRKVYAGFVGAMKSQKDFSFYVNLRCAQLFNNTIRFYAGAGITKDSIPKKELAETEAKMQVLKSVLIEKN